jgi:hypothetical protein
MIDHNGNMIETPDEPHMLIEQISTDKNSLQDNMVFAH